MEDKKEDDKVDLTPIEEKPAPKPKRLPETEARCLLNEITDICAIAQASISLPETTEIPKDSNFYVEEIFRTLKEFNLIVE